VRVARPHCRGERRGDVVVRDGDRLLQLLVLRLLVLVRLMFADLTSELLDLRASTCGKAGALFAMVVDCCCDGFRGW
jgi:hypothetical protein